MSVVPSEALQDEERSPFQLAVESREQWSTEVDLSHLGLVGHDQRELAKAVVVVNTGEDDYRALAGAYDKVAEIAIKAQRGKALLERDENIVDHCKLTEVVYRAFRQPGPVKMRPRSDGTKTPAPRRHLFLSPDWMSENLDPDTIGALANIYTEARKAKQASQGVSWDLDRETVETIRDACDETADTDVPEVLLAPYDREWCTSFIILAACYWREDLFRVVDSLKDLGHVCKEAAEALPDGKAKDLLAKSAARAIAAADELRPGAREDSA